GGLRRRLSAGARGGRGDHGGGRHLRGAQDEERRGALLPLRRRPLRRHSGGASGGGAEVAAGRRRQRGGPVAADSISVFRPGGAAVRAERTSGQGGGGVLLGLLRRGREGSANDEMADGPLPQPGAGGGLREPGRRRQQGAGVPRRQAPVWHPSASEGR